MGGDSSNPSEELKYGKRLAQEAMLALGTSWKNFWPEDKDETCPIAFYAEDGPYVLMKDLVSRAAIENTPTATPAICTVENISLAWCIQLGAAWKLDPLFFIEHVRGLSDALAKEALTNGAAPNSTHGVRASRGAERWCTLRGHVDHGLPKKDLESGELVDSTKRRNAQSLLYNSRLSHTNFSLYKVNDSYYLFLVDRLPDYQKNFVLDRMRWFPNQTLVRIATVDSPGFLTIPRLQWSRLPTVFPLWMILRDAVDKDVLIHSLKTYGVDEFLYKACLFQCEREIKFLALDIDAVSGKHIGRDQETTSQVLQNLQKALGRLKMCIMENRAYEAQLARAAVTGKALQPSRNDFEKLATEITGLDSSLMQCFYRLMMSLTATGIQDNLEQTRATTEQTQAVYEQTQSMANLTWLAFVFIPLTFVTGIFGMNVQEINDSPLSSKVAAATAGVICTVAFIVAQVVRFYGRRKTKTKREALEGMNPKTRKDSEG